MERIIGLMFSGFAVKLYAAAMAIWLASEVASYVTRVFGVVGHAL